jgi:hypothetical protein
MQSVSINEHYHQNQERDYDQDGHGILDQFVGLGVVTHRPATLLYKKLRELQGRWACCQRPFFIRATSMSDRSLANSNAIDAPVDVRRTYRVCAYCGTRDGAGVEHDAGPRYATVRVADISAVDDSACRFTADRHTSDSQQRAKREASESKRLSNGAKLHERLLSRYDTNR